MALVKRSHSSVVSVYSRASANRKCAGRRLLEISLSDLDKIRRKVDAYSAVATGKDPIGYNSVAAAKIKKNVVRLQLEISFNSGHNESNLVLTHRLSVRCAHHLALEILGIARARVRFVKRYDINL